jgi:hypothetical protein
MYLSASTKRAMLAGRGTTERVFGSCSLRAFNAVPPDVVETILGCLDLRTLCTTRLVCKLFRTTASHFLHSLKLSPEDFRFRRKLNFSNFPDLRQVSLLDVKAVDFPLLAQTPSLTCGLCWGAGYLSWSLEERPCPCFPTSSH